VKVDFEGGRIWSDKDTERLDHTNPSVAIDEMNGYQATYNKRWQNQSFLSVHVFTFVGADPHSIHGLLQPRQIMMKC
jgi:hypothetical protein